MENRGFRGNLGADEWLPGSHAFGCVYTFRMVSTAFGGECSALAFIDAFSYEQIHHKKAASKRSQVVCLVLPVKTELL